MTPLQSLHNLMPVTLASLAFIYVFMPAILFAYYIVPKKARPVVLLLVSFIFYAVSQPDYFVFILISVAADFLLTQSVAMTRRPLWRRVFLWICVVKNLFIIGYFGVMAQIRLLQPPLGVLIVCVLSIDAALEAYNEKGSGPWNLISFSLHALFFPRMYAGPVTRIDDFCKQLSDAEFNAGDIAVSFGRFIQGTFKFSVLGYELFSLHNSVRLIPEDASSVLSAWIFVLSFALSLYFSLSGLSDMARGIGGMLGLRLPQNFYYPYQSRSVSDFFERFNITAGGFLKRVVLEPLASNKQDPVADSLNILLLGMLWGIWFGMRVNYVVWGAFIAVFIIMEKYVYASVLKAMPTLFCRGYALCVALAGFTVFAGETLKQSGQYFISMFSFATKELYNDRILYVLSSNLLLLAVSCILATNLVSLFVDFMRKSRPRLSMLLFGAVDACILIVFTAITLGGGQL